jgi:hypothetical protein
VELVPFGPKNRRAGRSKASKKDKNTMSNRHSAKTDSQWKKDLQNLARKKVKLTGKKPPPSKKEFVATYDKITKCPVWLNNCKPLSGGRQSTLFGAASDVGGCNCGYSEYESSRVRRQGTLDYY